MLRQRQGGNKEEFFFFRNGEVGGDIYSEQPEILQKKNSTELSKRRG